MKRPQDLDELVAPILTLLVEKIRERTFTELEVEEVLGWDRHYIQQLRAGRKRLRVQEVLAILGVIGVEPEEFFAALYGEPSGDEGRRTDIAELSALADGIVNLLVKNGLVNAGELARAVAARAGKDLLPGAEEATAKAAEPPEAHGEPMDAPSGEATRNPIAGNDLPRSLKRGAGR